MKYTYLALGDSYTIGELVPAEQNFPHQTVALLNKKGRQVEAPVIIATTGWTTDELAAAIKERDVQGTFSFVTLLIGVNNQYRGRDIANYKQEYTQLLETAIKYAGGNVRKVFVLSIPDWGGTPFAAGKDSGKIAKEIDAYNNACEEITKKYNSHFLYITDSTRLNAAAEYLAEDGLHPGGKEYAVWAQRLSLMIMNELNQ